MSDVEKKLYRLLLFVAAASIAVSMVAGPLSHTSLAIGAAASALLIALCLLVYGLWFWPGRR